MPKPIYTVTTSPHPLNDPMSDECQNRANNLTLDEAVEMFGEYCHSLDVGAVQIWECKGLPAYFPREIGQLYI